MPFVSGIRSEQTKLSLKRNQKNNNLINLKQIGKYIMYAQTDNLNKLLMKFLISSTHIFNFTDKHKNTNAIKKIFNQFKNICMQF